MQVIHLVHGYVRMLDIKHQIIPISIINILIEFYYHISCIIYIQQNDDFDDAPPIICLAQLNENKSKYKCNIKLLNESTKNDIKYRTNTECGICYVTDFKLPQFIYKSNHHYLNKSNVYDIIFVSQDENDKCNAYIIDSI